MTPRLPSGGGVCGVMSYDVTATRLLPCVVARRHRPGLAESAAALAAALAPPQPFGEVHYACYLPSIGGNVQVDSSIASHSARFARVDVPFHSAPLHMTWSCNAAAAFGGEPCHGSPPTAPVRLLSVRGCVRRFTLRSVPFRSIPFHSIPFHSIPFRPLGTPRPRFDFPSRCMAHGITVRCTIP